jgi:hypothetical protein
MFLPMRSASSRPATLRHAKVFTFQGFLRGAGLVQRRTADSDSVSHSSNPGPPARHTGFFGSASARAEELARPEDEEDESVDEENDGSGSKVRLRRWDQRKRKTLGMEGVGGRPVPMIDRVHRLMQLWKAGELTKVNAFLEQASLARDPLFDQLVQSRERRATRSPARRMTVGSPSVDRRRGGGKGLRWAGSRRLWSRPSSGA